jgi:hypothetical protein
MSERGVVSMWCGGVRSVTDGWPCCSSWRVVGRLVSFCGGFGVVDDGGFGRGRGRCMCVGGREAGWLRGRWVLPLTVCLQAWWQLLPCPAHSRQMCVRNSHALHAHAHSQTARQPDSQTDRQTRAHTGSRCPAASQSTSPPAIAPARHRSGRAAGVVALRALGSVVFVVGASFVEAQAEASITHAAIFSRGIRACLHLPS